jgi:hypothetical protein
MQINNQQQDNKNGENARTATTKPRQYSLSPSLSLSALTALPSLKRPGMEQDEATLRMDLVKDRVDVSGAGGGRDICGGGTLSRTHQGTADHHHSRRRHDDALGKDDHCFLGGCSETQFC